MKNTAVTVALAAMTLPNLALAEQEGCYQRVYSAEHLAANPSQGVAALRVLFYRSSDYDEFSIGVVAQMSTQGQAARDGVAGMQVRANTFCHSFEEASTLVTCEKIGVGVLRQSDSELLIEANPWPFGPTTLHEGTGSATQYLLRAAPMSVCAGMET